MADEPTLIAEDVRPVHNWTWCQKYEPAPCGECSGCLALAEIRARIDGFKEASDG